MLNTQFRSLLTLGPLWCITRHCDRIRDDDSPRNRTLARSLNRRRTPSLSILSLHRSSIATLIDKSHAIAMIRRKSEKQVLSARRQKQEEEGCTVVARIYRHFDRHHGVHLLPWHNHHPVHDTHPPNTEFTTQRVPAHSDIHLLATG